MRILIDLDDVLGNFLEAWIAELNKISGKSLTTEDITEWNVNKFYNLEYDELWKPLSEKSFWRSVTPKEDSVDCVKSLIEAGHEVYVCTNTHYSTTKVKFDNFLFRHFPFLKNENIIICRDKKMINADIIIDDNPANLFGQEYSILFSAPHNKEWQEKGNKDYFVASSWKEVMKIIERIMQWENLKF